MERLLEFWDNYAGHQGQSDKCYLDGNYFWKVLEPFEGLVKGELTINVHHGQVVQLDSGCIGRPIDTEVSFDPDWFNDAQGPLKLIKMLVVGSTDEDQTLGTVHSNLLIVDEDKLEIIRFEPLFDEHYSHFINDKLKEYFSEIAPEFSYRMLDCHPQVVPGQHCSSRGMASAYVLKLAMVLITDLENGLPIEDACPFTHDPAEEEDRIRTFADAIETEYGDDNGELEGEPVMEFGYMDGFAKGSSSTKDSVLSLLNDANNSVFQTENVFTRKNFNFYPWTSSVSNVGQFVTANSSGDKVLLGAFGRLKEANDSLIDNIDKVYNDPTVDKKFLERYFKRINVLATNATNTLNSTTFVLPKKKDVKQVLLRLARLTALTEAKVENDLYRPQEPMESGYADGVFKARYGTGKMSKDQLVREINDTYSNVFQYADLFTGSEEPNYPLWNSTVYSVDQFVKDNGSNDKVLTAALDNLKNANRSLIENIQRVYSDPASGKLYLQQHIRIPSGYARAAQNTLNSSSFIIPKKKDVKEVLLNLAAKIIAIDGQVEQSLPKAGKTNNVPMGPSNLSVAPPNYTAPMPPGQ